MPAWSVGALRDRPLGPLCRKNFLRLLLSSPPGHKNSVMKQTSRMETIIIQIGARMKKKKAPWSNTNRPDGPPLSIGDIWLHGTEATRFMNLSVSPLNLKMQRCGAHPLDPGACAHAHHLHDDRPMGSHPPNSAQFLESGSAPGRTCQLQMNNSFQSEEVRQVGVGEK